MYRLNKRKKHFNNVYIKESLADNITFHVLTYVNIHPVWGPIHIGNSMFRFHCNTRYINQTKKNPNNFKIACSLTVYNKTKRMFQFQIHQQHCKHKVKHNFICVSSFFFILNSILWIRNLELNYSFILKLFPCSLNIRWNSL